MERLSIGTGASYDALESAIHVGRYALVRELCAGRRVLDVACGEGYGSSLMKSWGAAEVVGVDVSAEAVDTARANFGREGVSFQVSDAAGLLGILEQGSFDLVVSLETIEHVGQVEEFLANIRALSARDGHIVISCPNDHLYYSAEESNPFHLRKYYFDEFMDLTQGVLGSCKQVLLGVGVEGYANVPFSPASNLRTPPDGASAVSADPPLMVLSEVATDSQLTQSHSAYFVGVWGPTELSTSGAVFLGPPVYARVLTDGDAVSPRISVARARYQEQSDAYARLEEDNGERGRQLRQLELQIRDSRLLANARQVEIDAMKTNIALKDESSSRLVERFTKLEEELAETSAALCTLEEMYVVHPKPKDGAKVILRSVGLRKDWARSVRTRLTRRAPR